MGGGVVRGGKGDSTKGMNLNFSNSTSQGKECF